MAARGRRKDPLSAGLGVPLAVGALGALAIFFLRPSRDLDAAIAFLDALLAFSFLPGGLVIGRRSVRAPWRSLIVSLLVVGALRLVALFLLRLALPGLSLPFFSQVSLLLWFFGASLAGGLGVWLGVREGFSTIFLYEVRLWLRNPLTWVALSGFAGLSGASFVAHINEVMGLRETAGASVGAAIFIPTVLEQGSFLLFLTPLIALRYASAEGSPYTGLPVGPLSVALGRFFAVLLPALLACLVVVALPLTLGPYARLPLWGSLVAMLGLALVAAVACALALLFAEIGRSALGAGGLGLFFALLASFARTHADDSPNAWVRVMLRSLSFSEPLEPFSRGVLDARAVIYFVSITALGIFFTVRLQDARRWL